MRCLGSVNTIWITDALNGGWDGVMMMGCKKGDDYQCHFVKGSEMAHYRMSKIGDTLKQLGLEPERVQTQEVAITDNAHKDKIMEAMVMGTPCVALCGKVWIPSRDPKKFPVCPTCKAIFEDDSAGWVPEDD